MRQGESVMPSCVEAGRHDVQVKLLLSAASSSLLYAFWSQDWNKTKNHSTNTDRTRILISISYFSISYTNTWHLLFENLPLLKRVRVRFMVVKVTQQYFSYILWSVLLVEETRAPDGNQQPRYRSLPLLKRKHKWLSNFYFNLNRKFFAEIDSCFA